MNNALRVPYVGEGEASKFEGTIETVSTDETGELFLATLWDRDDVELGRLSVRLSSLKEAEARRVRPGMIIFVEIILNESVELLQITSLVIAEWKDTTTDGKREIHLRPTAEEFFQG